MRLLFYSDGYYTKEVNKEIQTIAKFVQGHKSRNRGSKATQKGLKLLISHAKRMRKAAAVLDKEAAAVNAIHKRLYSQSRMRHG